MPIILVKFESLYKQFYASQDYIAKTSQRKKERSISLQENESSLTCTYISGPSATTHVDCSMGLWSQPR